MRVLITLLAMAAGACYSPDVEDCQFRCGVGDACPAGTSCMSGVCRSEATGNCPSTTDACLVAPPLPGGCGQKIPIDGGTLCATICPNQRSWLEARMDCAAAGWQLAILDSPTRLASVPQALELYWVGANRSTSSSPWLWLNNAPVAAEAWSNGVPSNGTGGDCTALGGLSRKLYNDMAAGRRARRSTHGTSRTSHALARLRPRRGPVPCRARRRGGGMVPQSLA
jgi:hypothetical protein